MPVQSPLYRWVKQCHRSPRTWIPIHTEFHWVSAQESHRMLIIMMWLDLSNLSTTFSWLPKSLKSSDQVYLRHPWLSADGYP